MDLISSYTYHILYQLKRFRTCDRSRDHPSEPTFPLKMSKFPISLSMPFETKNLNLNCPETILNLKSKLNSQGFLFLKQFVPLSLLSKAKQEIDIFMETNDSLINNQEFINNNEVLQELFEFEGFYRLMQTLLETETVVQTEFKWLRSVKPGLYTGLHNDRFYLGDYEKILTIWMPITRIRIEDGGMVIGREEGDRWDQIRDLYKTRLPSDGTSDGWLAPTDDISDILKLVEGEEKMIASEIYEIGDVVVLKMETIHMTLPNQSNQNRISCDLRFIGQ